VDQATLRTKYAALSAVLTERSRRLWAATEAQAIGSGGIAQVVRATGIAASTIQRGVRDLSSGAVLATTRTRRAGGGRKRATDVDATLLRDLDALVEPTAPGDPDSPLRWTCLSARTLAVALDGLGHDVSHTVVAELLHGLGYSLQGNVKTREGRQHADRDAQFATSHDACAPHNGPNSRRSRSIRRRRNSLGTSRTPAVRGARRHRRNGCGSMTS
jgi:stage V sporulation protein SpoVS